MDTRLLTEEGTQQVREELKEDVAQTLERQRTKLSNLSDEQVEKKRICGKAFKATSLHYLDRAVPFLVPVEFHTRSLVDRIS
ncbi:MAG: hypothetical protein HC780_22465 [Leptolyngbyaceae cyanobacterium CSU_1_3]|nr:hypothetical protein [Leptolyngbyaceae cyanobacterium CSU_1_3]